MVPKLYLLALVALSVVGSASAQPIAVRFTQSDSLVVGVPDAIARADCQPLKGDFAEVTGLSVKALGAEVLPVRVTTGRCAGARGWAGTTAVETAGASAPAENESVRFASSDVLYASLTPSLVKASCQPLRGDTASLLEAGQLGPAQVYRLKVLTGRCAGATGWAGASGLERAAALR
jgi:hypothetical protein